MLFITIIIVVYLCSNALYTYIYLKEMQIFLVKTSRTLTWCCVNVKKFVYFECLHKMNLNRCNFPQGFPSLFFVLSLKFYIIIHIKQCMFNILYSYNKIYIIIIKRTYANLIELLIYDSFSLFCVRFVNKSYVEGIIFFLILSCLICNGFFLLWY